VGVNGDSVKEDTSLVLIEIEEPSRRKKSEEPREVKAEDFKGRGAMKKKGGRHSIFGKARRKSEEGFHKVSNCFLGGKGKWN